MDNVVIYTDGAYSSSRDIGAIGIVILHNDKLVLKYSRKYDGISNNKAELAAIIIALKAIKKSVDTITIYTDSMYCIGCTILGWKRNKNKLLWEEFDKQFRRVSELCPNITFKHVKGHQKDNSEETKWNNCVDRLAVSATTLI